MRSNRMNTVRCYKNELNTFENIREYRNKINIHLRKQRRENLVWKTRSNSDLKDANEYNTNKTFDELINIISQANQTDMRLAIKCIRKKVTENLTENTEYIIARRTLISLLCNIMKQNKDSEIQYETAWSLVNICSVGEEDVKLVVEANGISCFLSLLNTPSNRHREIGVWGVGNIIGSSLKYRDIVLQHNFIDILWRTIQLQTTSECHSRIAWCMVNICRSFNTNISQQILETIINILIFMLEKTTDFNTLLDTTTAIILLIEANPLIIDVIIVYNFVPLLMNVINKKEPRCLASSIRIFGIISSGSEKQRQTVLNCGLFKLIPDLFNNSDSRVRRELLILLSNIASGNSAQKQYILQYNLIPIIIYHMKLKNEYINQKEAAWIICHLVKNCNSILVEVMVNEGILQAFFDVLTVQDYHLIVLTLVSISYIFHSLNVLEANIFAGLLIQTQIYEMIDQFQYSEDDTISKIANDLMEKLHPKSGNQNNT